MKKLFLILIILILSLNALIAQLYSDIQSIVPADTTSDVQNWYSVKDNSGNTIITGQFVGIILFSGSALTLSYPEGWGPGPDHPDSYKTFIAKLNSDGIWAWAKKIDNTKFFIGGIATDASGNIYVTGDFQGTASLDNVTITSTANYSDIFVAKLNSSGTFQWAKTEGTNKGPDYGRDIAVDGSGNSIIIGSYSNKKLTSGPASWASDVFIAKFNSSGVRQWSKNIGNSTGPIDYASYTNAGFTIALDVSGNIFGGGRFIGRLRFDNITVNTHAANLFDAFAVKFNGSGATQWVKTGYTSNHTALLRNSNDNSGNLFFTGSGGTGNLVFNGTTYPNATNNFLIKLSNNGSPQWTVNSDNSYGFGAILVNTEGNIDVQHFFNGLVGPGVNYLKEYSSNGALLFTETLDNVATGDVCKNITGVTVTMNFEKTVTLLTASGDVTITIPAPTVPSSSTPEIFGVFIANYVQSPPLQIINGSNILSFDYSETNSDLEVFPNPAGDHISIRLNNIEQISELIIFDQLGKKVYSHQLGEGETNLNIDLTGNGFVNGIYFLSALFHGEQITSRFVIDR